MRLLMRMMYDVVCDGTLWIDWLRDTQKMRLRVLGFDTLLRRGANNAKLPFYQIKLERRRE